MIPAMAKRVPTTIIPTTQGLFFRAEVSAVRADNEVPMKIRRTKPGMNPMIPPRIKSLRVRAVRLRARLKVRKGIMGQSLIRIINFKPLIGR